MVDRQASAIADAWIQAVRPLTTDAVSASDARAVVDRLARRIVDLAHGQEPWSPDAVDDLADQLLALQLPYHALASLQEILIRQLIEEPAGSGDPPVRARALMGALTASLLRRQEALVLEEQRRVTSAHARALRREQRRLRLADAAVRSFAWGLALWSLDGHIVHANPAFARLWGRDQRQILDTNPISALWGGQPTVEAINASVRETGVWLGQVGGVRGDGSPVMAMLAAGLVELDDGTPPLVMGSFGDMSDLKGVSGMLQQRIDQLRALHQVDRGILAARSPAAIGEAALRHIRELVPCHRASVILFAPGDERAEFLAAVPESEYPDAMRRDFPLRGFEDVIEALHRGEVAVFDDLRRLGVSLEAVERLDRGQRRTYAVVPLRCDGTLLGSLNLTLGRGSELIEQQRTIARQIADSLAVAIRQAQLNATVAEHEAHLRALTARLAEGDEAERRRLSRDLHDEIGQKLTALGINLNVVKARLGPQAPPELVSRLDDSLELVMETTERVRRVIAELRPPMLDEYGLLPTLRWCADQLAIRTDVEVVVRGQEPAPRLPSRVEDALVRIAQEALTNVAKHARATRVTITLGGTADGVRLTIGDNGVGFENGVIDQRASPHWGLLTMTERAAAVGGRCAIESQPGEGTQVIVEVRP